MRKQGIRNLMDEDRFSVFLSKSVGAKYFRLKFSLIGDNIFNDGLRYFSSFSMFYYYKPKEGGIQLPVNRKRLKF